MQQYHDLLRHVLANGHQKTDRTGVGTLSCFGYQMRFDLAAGFPLLTTKRVPFSLVKSELLWFLRGDTNLKYLLEHQNHIWDEWGFKKWVESPAYQGPDMTDFGNRSQTDPVFNQVYQKELARFCDQILTNEQFAQTFGNLGPVYGAQWRSWPLANGETLDQISQVIEMIQHQPDSRRLIVTAWNPAQVAEMALPPCHTLFQFYVHDQRLSCQLYQRSADIFLGVPFNIASYALLTHLIARACGLQVGEFIHTLGDAHIYLNHLEQVKTQLSRPPKSLPQLKLSGNADIFNLDMADILLENYFPDATIKAPIAV